MKLSRIRRRPAVAALIGAALALPLAALVVPVEQAGAVGTATDVNVTNTATNPVPVSVMKTKTIKAASGTVSVGGTVAQSTGAIDVSNYRTIRILIVCHGSGCSNIHLRVFSDGILLGHSYLMDSPTQPLTFLYDVPGLSLVLEFDPPGGGSVTYEVVGRTA